MKTVSKKLLSVLLVAILLVSAIPFQALAEEPGAGEPASIAEPTPDAAPAPAADATPVADPVTPVPADATPVDATPVTSAPADATPVDATPVTSAPADATPVDATPVTSAPADSTPVANTPATTFEHDGNFCQVSGFKKDDTFHWIECLTENCTAHINGTHLNEVRHVFKDASGNPADCECGAKCGVDRPHDYQLANVKNPTCIGEGYSGDMVCTVCGAKDPSQPGKTIPATGVHTFDPNTHVCTTPGCGKTEDGTAAQLTLDANGGSINGGASMNVNVTTGKPISTLPDATRPGYTFGGWWTELTGGVRVYAATTYDASFTKVYARWVENTFPLTVRYVLNGDFRTAHTIETFQVSAGTPLLDYLNTNVKDLVRQELALHPGFTWEYKFWKDYSGRQPLTDQTACMNQAQTVFVNFVSQSYNLYFHPNEGTVTPNSKPVYFGSAVGPLPVPYREGKVFKGWVDANGVEYTATTTYQVAGDTTLTAKWQDEATVLLYVYINGSFAACDRMIAMDQFVQNDNISRADVYAEVAKHYVPASGYLNIAGLFDDYTWGSYKVNTSKPGVENIQIDGSRVNRIYVMVTNALTGATVVTNPTNPGGTITLPNGSTITIPQNSYWVATGTNTGYWVQGTAPQGSYWVSTGNGNGYWVYPTAGTNPGTIVIPTYVWVGTNPKTGDTSMIEAAAAVMVLAAAALVTVISLRKKKMAK